MILVAEPAGSQLSATAYQHFSLGYTRKIISSLSRQCVLHICGEAEHLVGKMCQSGAVALSFDNVDIASVIRLVPENIVVIGNISPLKFAQNSAEDIEEETVDLLEATKNRKAFFVAPGCDLAPRTPLENIQSFVKVVKEHHR